MADIAEVLASARKPRTRVKLALAGDLVVELDRLHERRRQLEEHDDALAAPAELAALDQQIEQLRAEAETSEVEFVLEAVGARTWADLMAQHAPSIDDAKAGLDHDPRTFPSAAIAASLVDPTGVTAENVEQLRDQLSTGQWAILWGACLSVNLGGGSIPKSVRRSAGTRGSDARPTSSASTGSLAASSSDE